MHYNHDAYGSPKSGRERTLSEFIDEFQYILISAKNKKQVQLKN